MQMLTGTRARTQAPSMYKPHAGQRPEEKLVTKGVTVAFAHPTPQAEWKCADVTDPELFHPTDAASLEEAVRFCADCPARALCLELGRSREEFGVWGGVLLEGGKPLTAVRRPGRPKKVEVAA
ncbi:MAG: WhiB family transcriptional regulator [Nocardioides sp.]